MTTRPSGNRNFFGAKSRVFSEIYVNTKTAHALAPQIIGSTAAMVLNKNEHILVNSLRLGDAYMRQ